MACGQRYSFDLGELCVAAPFGTDPSGRGVSSNLCFGEFSKPIIGTIRQRRAPSAVKKAVR